MPQLYCTASVETDDVASSACRSFTCGSLTASRALLQLVPTLASHLDSHAQTPLPCLSVSFGVPIVVHMHTLTDQQTQVSVASVWCDIDTTQAAEFCKNKMISATAALAARLDVGSTTCFDLLVNTVSSQ